MLVEVDGLYFPLYIIVLMFGQEENADNPIDVMLLGILIDFNAVQEEKVNILNTCYAARNI